MKKTVIKSALISLLILVSVGACGLLQEPERASAPIEATPLATEVVEPTSPEDVVQTEVVEVEAEGDGSMEASAPGEALLFTISQAESEVRFELDEDLRSQRTTVVGITDQVAGEIAVDLADLSTAQVGVMRINARTLLTDNSFRNRAIQNEILDTGEFEFITFEPTSIDGLPESVGVGEQITFTIEGDLTIRDITQPIVFSVVAKADSASQISGTATAIVQRADFDLNIPNVPNVANVEEEVELYIDFVAIAG